MSEQQMPARIVSRDPDKLSFTPWESASDTNPPAVIYIRADIAERMAEALDRIVSICTTDQHSDGIAIGRAQEAAQQALSAFKDAGR